MALFDSFSRNHKPGTRPPSVQSISSLVGAQALGPGTIRVLPTRDCSTVGNAQSEAAAGQRPQPDATQDSGSIRMTKPIVSTGTPVPSNAGPITYGGVECRKEVITTEDALLNAPFYKVINSEVKVAAWLYSKIAVVQLTEGSKDCAFFINRDEVAPDVVADIAQLLRNSNYQVVKGYFAVSKLIISLSQGHISGDTIGNRREIARDPTKSALFQEFRKVVAWAYDQKADDIDWALNLQAQDSQIAFKIGGRYIRPPQHVIKSETMSHMLGIAWQLSGGGSSAQFDSRIEQQAQITMELPAEAHRPKGAKLRLRWSGMAIDKGAVVTMRIQRLGESALVRSLESAGYLKWHMAVLKRVIRSEGGLVCFAGVVGSGKSTSLAQLIALLPNYLKIQSIEDPVELDIPNAYQKTLSRVLTQAEADPAFLSAARALYRSALDVLYLGEVRDTETGGIARQVVESGHTVYTTTHARSGLGIIERLTSPQINIPREVLGAPGIIKLLIFQALLPVNCEHCAVSPTDAVGAFKITGEAAEHHEEYWSRVERLFHLDRDKFRLRNPDGCPHCRKDGIPELNGFSGRTVVCEMIEPDEEMGRLILKGDTAGLHAYWRGLSDGKYDSLDMTGKNAMESAIYKAAQGLIDMREVEDRFEAFETIEVKLNMARAHHARPKLKPVASLRQDQVQESIG